jgi:predicted ATPase
MKIVQLDIQGFRSLKNVSWRPGDLNVVIGPNGSGKSNLLKMLEMVSASARGELSRHVQSEGGINAILWDGEAFELDWKIKLCPRILTALNHSYSANLMRSVFSSSYTVREELLSTTTFHVGEQDEEVTNLLMSRLTDNALYYDDDNKQVNIPKGAVSEEETVVSLANNPMAFNNKILPLIASDFSNQSIYQDIRTDQNALIRQAPVSRSEHQVAPDGQNLINVLHTLYTKDRQFEQDINDAMFAAFGDDYEKLVFAPDLGDQRVQMRIRWKTLKRDQSTADLSDGTLRFLFLMTVLASPNPPPLIAIDEPETGLHPSMLPIIAEFAVEAATRTQVIFTTHSDQFLSAFRDTRPTVTIAKWESGETTLTTVDDSELEYWVKDYSLGKLFRSGELENLAS